MELSKLKPNKENPRIILDYRFEKVVDSILQFPEMMEKRGLIIDKKKGTLGGNMRLRALYKIILEMSDEELRRRCEDKAPLIEFWQKIRTEKSIPDNWIQDVSGWTEQQKKRFIIADNTGSGQWDWEVIINEWDYTEVESWGLEIPAGWNPDKLEQVNNLRETEWVGMPDFEPADNPYKIVINFETEAERDKYAEDNGLNFIKKESKAWTTWFPFRTKDDLESLRYE